MYKSRIHLPPPQRHTVQIAVSTKDGGDGQRKTSCSRGHCKGVPGGPLWGCLAAGHLGHYWVLGHDILSRHSQSIPLNPFRKKYGFFTSPGQALTLPGQPSCPCLDPGRSCLVAPHTHTSQTPEDCDWPCRGYSLQPLQPQHWTPHHAQAGWPLSLGPGD